MRPLLFVFYCPGLGIFNSNDPYNSQAALMKEKIEFPDAPVHVTFPFYEGVRVGLPFEVGRAAVVIIYRKRKTSLGVKRLA
jgi:hypothetical protein